jgi:hypothetical protein
MVNWSDFELAAPALADAGRRLWGQMDLAYLATVSASGWPRVHPVVVVFVEGDLLVSVAMQSPKFADLQRDGRCALHTPPINADDEELFLRGRLVPHNDDAGRARFDGAAPFRLTSYEFVFALDIDRALWTRWHHPGQPDTRPIRELWRAG